VDNINMTESSQPSERTHAACHEAGHTVIAAYHCLLTSNHDLTIEPDGSGRSPVAQGWADWRDVAYILSWSREKSNLTGRKQIRRILRELETTIAGYAAEDVAFGISNFGYDVERMNAIQFPEWEHHTDAEKEAHLLWGLWGGLNDIQTIDDDSYVDYDRFNDIHFRAWDRVSALLKKPEVWDRVCHLAKMLEETGFVSRDYVFDYLCRLGSEKQGA
jgi:hypothetical protein